MTIESPDLIIDGPDNGWLTQVGPEGPIWPEHPDLEEQDLIRRVVGGEAEAYGALFDRYHDDVYNYVFHVVGTDAEAEAVTDRTFSRDHAEIASRDPGVEPYDATLFRLAAVEAQRPPDLRERILNRLFPNRPQPPLEISAAWQKIRKDDRVILALRYKAQYDVWQIAEILGFDPEYVAQTIEDCRELFSSE